MAETLTYQALKNTRLAKETEDQRKTARKRNIFVLIRDYLYQMGYVDTSTTLESEINIDLNQFSVCDNVDLDTILQDYESYYYVRFQKYPQIIKKLPEGGNGQQAKDKQWKIIRTSKGAASAVFPKEKHTTRRRAASCFPAPVTSPTKCETHVPSDSQSSPSLTLNGQQISGSRKSPCERVAHNHGIQDFGSELLPSIMAQESRLLKPLGLYSGYNEEWKELASVIGKDIYQYNPNVKWENIIGLDEAKRLIKESVVYPIKYPQLFTGILAPWKGLLLYGPPGTGKTLLAKAVATECQTTFFNISASSIVSKWRGDSEKLVRVLFELARFHAPSTIFVDELDSLMGQRDGTSLGSEHEGSRRMKTELLIQMDGLSKTDDLVFLLAASNLPWELDHAMLRRLEKRILVGLPNISARQSMFEYFLPPVIYSHGGLRLTCQLNYSKLAEFSDGYSGSDILLVSKEAAMQRVRKVLELLEQPKKEGNEPPKLSVDTITTKDVEVALQKTKPSARRFSDKYDAWQKEFGST